MKDEYDPETYRAWTLRVEKFLANWPYDGVFADPPFRPTRKGERVLPRQWSVSAKRRSR